MATTTTTFADGQAFVPERNTHSKLIGYVLWIFGFTGSHRFYFGKPITGTIWLFTGGLFLIGWFIDLFLIPGMDRAADSKYVPGRKEYTIAWVLLTFLGAFGLHRFYLGKWLSGLFYLLVSLTFFVGGFLLAPLVLIGIIYDFWTLNGQVSEVNSRP